MEREIKFRAWDNKLLIILPQSEMSCHKDFKEFGSRATLEGFLLNPDYILMQYTGEKDCNGNEIYEGDIIDILDEDFKVLHENVVVEFKYGMWYPYVQYGDTDFHYGLGLFEDIELQTLLKGNIYQNSELL